MDMRNRKFQKKTVWALALIMMAMLLLCSCSNEAKQNDDPAEQNPASKVEEGETLSQEHLVMATDPYGGLFKSGVGTKEGFYEQMIAFSDSMNILYTDYETGVRTYLCASPECLHNGDTCTSWFDVVGELCLFSNADQSQMFLFSGGDAYAAVDGKQPQGGCIYQFDPDGSNRKVLYQLAGNEEFTGAVAVSDFYIYIKVQIVDTDTEEMSFEIRKINMETGESKSIYKTKNINERIAGAFDEYIVLDEVTESERNYYNLNVSTGEKSDAKYSYHYLNETRIEETFGEYGYSLRKQDDLASALYEIDMKTGQEREVCGNIEIYNTDATRILDRYDGHIEIETSDTRDANNIQLLKYEVNLENGESKLCQLKYDMFGTIKNVPILAENDTDFLVQAGVKNGEITVVDEMGVPSRIETAILQYALISKADYWNNVDNYRAINNSIDME